MKIKVNGIEIEVDDLDEVYDAILLETGSYTKALAAVDEINNNNYEVL